MISDECVVTRGIDLTSLDNISCRSWNLGHDGSVCAAPGIHETRFSDIRPPHDGNLFTPQRTSSTVSVSNAAQLEGLVARVVL